MEINSAYLKELRALLINLSVNKHILKKDMKTECMFLAKSIEEKIIIAGEKIR